MSIYGSMGAEKYGPKRVVASGEVRMLVCTVAN